jgi:hypothetical protein
MVSPDERKLHPNGEPLGVVVYDTVEFVLDPLTPPLLYLPST